MAINFKVSKLRKYTLIALLTLVFAVEFIDLNLPETVAIAWHLRHGFKTQCCGVQVHVPLKYSVTDDDPRALTLSSNPGAIRWKLFHSPISSISLFAQAGNYDRAVALHGKEILFAAYERAGDKLMGSKTILVAGKSMECSEFYNNHLDVLGPQNEVFCWRDGLSLNFTGSPALLNEFYSIVQGTQAIRQTQ